MCVCESTLTFLCLMARASRSMLIIAQQVATLYSLFISANCCTCFGCYLYPSSGARITVSTVSCVAETVTATATFTTGSSNGVSNARYCRYSDMSS